MPGKKSSNGSTTGELFDKLLSAINHEFPVETSGFCCVIVKKGESIEQARQRADAHAAYTLLIAIHGADSTSDKE